MAQPTPEGHYVYIHRRASNHTPFYVGKGAGRRAWGLQGRNPWWRRTVEKHGYEVEIVRAGLSESCAFSLERALIFALKGRGIVNLVDGGGGTSGWKHSPETKARIGAFHKGRQLTERMRAALEASRQNMVFTPIHRARMSAARRGRKFGSRSPETCAKISASHIGMRPSAETLQKMSAAKKGHGVGKNSPSYDHTVRVFVHPTHGEFVGTRGDLILAYGLGPSDMSALLNGNRKSVKGWRVL